MSEWRSEEMKNEQIHPLNGVAHADGVKAEQFRKELAVVGELRAMSRAVDQLKRGIDQLLENFIGKREQAPLAFEDQPDPKRPDVSKWLNWKPEIQKGATPLEALDLSEGPMNAIKRLPFPVNSVEDLTSRVREEDLLRVKWVGKFTVRCIVQALKEGRHPPLLPDDWWPGPCPEGLDPIEALNVVLASVQGQTPEDIAKEFKLPLSKAVEVIHQGFTIWEKVPHHLVCWAWQKGWRPPEPPKQEKANESPTLPQVL